MSTAASAGAADVDDEKLWKSLTMLSKNFPGKSILIYTSTNPALGKEDTYVCTLLHCFSSLMVRYREVVASAATRRTAQHLKLLVCKTNDERAVTFDPSSASLGSYTVARNARPDTVSPSAAGITIERATTSTFPIDSSGFSTIECLLEAKWKMSWEEHVSFLTFLTNRAIEDDAKQPFIRYCLLTAAPKKNIRLLKTPLNKREVSFFEIFDKIDMSLVGNLPIIVGTNGLPFNASATVAEFFSTDDLAYLKAALENNAYSCLSFSFLEQIIYSTSPMKMRLNYRGLQVLASQLWALIQHSLRITKDAYSKIRANTEVNEKVLTDVRYVLVVVFAFMSHCLYESRWLNWLVTKHAAEMLAGRIRQNLVSDVVSEESIQVEEEDMIESDEASEISDDTGGGSTTQLAGNVFAWLKLSYNTLAQANTVLQRNRHMNRIEVDVMSCANVEKECTPWKEAIHAAYGLQYDRDQAKAKAERTISKIDHLRKNGDEKERAWLVQTGRKWAFSGAVHCETVLASEHLQKNAICDLFGAGEYLKVHRAVETMLPYVLHYN